MSEKRKQAGSELCQALAQLGQRAEAITEQNLHLKSWDCFTFQVQLISSYQKLSSIEVVFPGGRLPSLKKIKIKLKIVLSLT